MRHAIALLHAERLQHIGESRNFGQQAADKSSVRVSPGSPSQMMAALFLRHVAACRSRQLYERFNLPPTNHLAKGRFHSSTFVPGLEPVELARDTGPEGLGIAVGFLVEPLILLGARNMGLGPELFRTGENALFIQCGMNVDLSGHLPRIAPARNKLRSLSSNRRGRMFPRAVTKLIRSSP